MRLLVLASLLAAVGCGKKMNEVKGIDGSDGVSCYTQDAEGGVHVVCGNTSTFIANGYSGHDGAAGRDGKDGSFDGYFEYVTVCEDIPGNLPETLLYLDGQYLAYINGGYYRDRLSVLEENITYRTTDGRNVYFKIVDSKIECLTQSK